MMDGPCYEVHIGLVSSPKSYVEALTPNVMVSGDTVLGREWRLDEVRGQRVESSGRD